MDKTIIHHHPHVRRRKKRPNYGTRTVEVVRGKNGFGVTISGQQPCILSCIVSGSPAEKAGLRAGDYLVAVEGKSVSKVPHDEVVRMINCSQGHVLRLQIAENYYSDSSSEDDLASGGGLPISSNMSVIRNCPGHKSHLTSSKSGYSHHHHHQPKYRSAGRVARAVRELRGGTVFDRPMSPKLMDWDDPRVPPPQPFRIPSQLQSHNCELMCQEDEETQQEVYRAIVGYVGTIEMPRQLPLGSRIQIVRGCIKKLRAEKRTHTAVFMKVMTGSLRLINGAGITLAVYPRNRVTFCGSSSDKDKRHFGIVTTANGENPSSSCHVFVIDSRPHIEHHKRAKIFKIQCHVDPITGFCKEFPPTCDSIVSTIKNFFENKVADEPVTANSPQPSNDSTTTISNSDSGIGFRDDCGNQSDRILVVDVQNQRLHIQELNEGGHSREKLTVQAVSESVPIVDRSRSSLSTGSEGPGFMEDMSISSGATKSPDVTVVSKLQCNYNSYLSESRSTDDLCFNNKRCESLLINYKLSPKTFGILPPTSQSLEDLKDSTADTINRNELPHWGSLQDLRSFVLNSFKSVANGDQWDRC